MTDISIPHSLGLPTSEHDRPRHSRLVVDGRAITYQDVGDGPAVILAHGLGGAHDSWAPLVMALSNRYRVLTPRLLGYGWREARTPDLRLHPWSDCAVLLALAEHVGDSVHIVGHSYGATVALEAARALGRRTRSLTLIEPIGFHLFRLASQVRQWREIPIYHRVDTPTRLIVGQRTPRPARSIVDELLRILPDAHLKIIPQAEQSNRLTHPDEVAALVAAHLDDTECCREPDCDGSAPTGERRRSIA
jgi:pimeloyl-ACP methyl ester carboxylesterase